MHYHVKSNTGGVLRDEQFGCVDEAALATLVLSQKLGQLANDLWDGCDRQSGSWSCGVCGWCRAAKEATNARAHMPNVTRVATDLFGASEVVVDNPASASHAYILWMERVPGQRGTCTDHLDR